MAHRGSCQFGKVRFEVGGEGEPERVTDLAALPRVAVAGRSL